MSDRAQTIVNAYCKWVVQHVNMGFHPSLLTIMFKEIPAPGSVREEIMRRDIEKLYAHILPRVVRHPNSKHVRDLPLWITASDFPAFKRNRDRLSDIEINGGLHKHAITLQPSFNRLKTPFAEHVMSNQDRYKHGSFIEKLHAVDIVKNPAGVTDYILKSVKRGVTSNDSIIVLPRLPSEMTGARQIL